MNTTTHEELLQTLRELHEALPDMRFGQLVCNLATAARGPEPESTWDVEDDELLDSARQQLEAVREKTSARS
jgi:hypothetical protein